MTSPTPARNENESSGARRAAEEIVRTLRGAGHVAYFAGGCVRDELLGLEPSDYDVATDATPQRIAGLFKRTSEVGASFGVVLVKSKGQSVEVATFRSDGAYSDRRRPDRVTFSDPESDARRRDFTVNALFLDPLERGEHAVRGRVIDYVDGMADLERRLLRAVGDPDQRLSEDHLRALRCVRLSARLGFDIDPQTGAAICRHAGDLVGISRERIGEELRMMLAHPTRGTAVGRLHELDLDAPVLNEGHLPPSVGELVGALGATGEPVHVTTVLGAWAIGRHGGPAAAAGVVPGWRSSLCLSNGETEALRNVLIGVELLEQRWLASGVAAQKRAAATEWFGEAVRLVCVRDGRLADKIEAREAELRAMPPGIGPIPLVSGEDLIAAGLKPGPAFKTILDRVYDSQLEASVSSREEALALALNLSRGTGV